MNFVFCYRFEAVYAKQLPESILGEAFLNKYIDHNDTVTTIDPNRNYAVKAPAKHPVYEDFRVKVGSCLCCVDLFYVNLLNFRSHM